MIFFRNNWFLASMSIFILLLGTFFIVRAMDESGEGFPTEEKATTTYFFIGTDVDQAANPNFWSDDPNDSQICDDEEELPCSVELEESIEDYLKDKTKDHVMADPSVNKRSK